MSEKRFTTDKAPVVIITEANRDVVVKGWGEHLVTIEGSQVEAAESEKGITIRGLGDLVVMVPHAAALSILQCHRDLAVKGVEGEVVIGTADRDVVLRRTGNVTIGQVHHDLVIRDASGNIQVEQVNGDFSLRDVRDVVLGTVYGDFSGRDIDGRFIAKEIMGDMSLRGVAGDVNLGVIHRDTTLKGLEGLVNLAQSMGDVRLNGPLSPGKHQLQCQRDLVLRWPEGSPLTLTATAPKIVNRLELDDVNEENETVSGQIGEGGPVLFLTANRSVILKPSEMVDEKWFKFAFDDNEFDVDMNFSMEDLGAKISGEVNKRMADVRQRMAQMSAEMEHRIGTEFAGKFEAQAQHWAEKAEKALSQAEKALKQNRQKAAAAATPASTPAAKTPISPEEKLKILKMLEKGVITVDEANNLLTALEG
ncbi:MAG: hypothetical protein KA314_01200 [Chloroflexi bacterium]|nr:hypothetical protein [Chloroflexota bacterium]MBP8054423.1 hypothetical protein [Chloroflexota bacterium]